MFWEQISAKINELASSLDTVGKVGEINSIGIRFSPQAVAIHTTHTHKRTRENISQLESQIPPANILEHASATRAPPTRVTGNIRLGIFAPNRFPGEY